MFEFFFKESTLVSNLQENPDDTADASTENSQMKPMSYEDQVANLTRLMSFLEMSTLNYTSAGMLISKPRLLPQDDGQPHSQQDSTNL
jgi:hypothetical protein